MQREPMGVERKAIHTCIELSVGAVVTFKGTAESLRAIETELKSIAEEWVQ